VATREQRLDRVRVSLSLDPIHHGVEWGYFVRQTIQRTS